MKTYINKILLFSAAVLFMLSCIEDVEEGRFYEESELTITAYLEENSERYSKLLEILETTGFRTTLNAYGTYTFLAFDNEAIDAYISGLGRSSLSDFTSAELELLVRYHALPTRRFSSEFGNTRMPDSTISGDFLVTTFDASGIQGIKINRTATINTRDIELSNGIIHTIDRVLPPIVKTVPELLEDNGNYTLFTEALKNTGWYDSLERLTFQLGESTLRNNITLLVEPDSVYNNLGINSYADLADRFSDLGQPTNEEDSLNLFVANHIIRNTIFLGDLGTQNYETQSGSLISVDVDGDFFEINTLGDDSLRIFQTFIEPASNQQAKNGVFHAVQGIRFLQGQLTPRSDLLDLFVPPASYVLWEFSDQPEWTGIIGSRGRVWEDDLTLYSRIKGEVSSPEGFTYWGQGESQYLNSDFFYLKGSFDATFTLPKIVQGKYQVGVATKGGSGRAVVQFFMNGQRLGDPFDLNFGFSFATLELGSVNFKETAENELRIISVNPGQAFLDYIEFRPTE